MRYVPEIALPKMARVRLDFETATAVGYERTIPAGIWELAGRGKLAPGKCIAVAVGSRGITNIADIVRCVVQSLKEIGCLPVIVPAMGSHGGACPEEQRSILKSYGIDAGVTGADIVSSMQTSILGSYRGKKVHCDAFAAQCDGVIAVNRIKVHTDFAGPIESGICKMLAVGLGKHDGALMIHDFGPQEFPTVVPDVAKIVIDALPYVAGIGIVEDAYHQTAAVEVIDGESILDREKELLAYAKKIMGKLPFADIDVLILDEVGKNISGSSMDPNITGRNYFPWNKSGPRVDKIVALNLHAAAHGDAIGVGNADIITEKIFKQMDLNKMYTTAATSKSLSGCKIPFIAKTDKEAIVIAAHCVIRKPENGLRICRIKNTLDLDQIEVSEALLREVNTGAQVNCRDFQFDGNGNLV